MAYVSISNITQNGCTWTIEALSNPFIDTYYDECGVTNSSFADGTSSIGGIVDCVTPAQTSNPSSTITWYASGTTYTLYGYARSKYGKYYTCSSATFTTIKPRPANFYWSNQASIVANGNYQIFANDWNRLTQTIQQFETYMSKPVRGFATAGSNTSFTATMFNQGVNAIDELNYTGIPAKISGDRVYAYDFITMQGKINSIP